MGNSIITEHGTGRSNASQCIKDVEFLWFSVEFFLVKVCESTRLFDSCMLMCVCQTAPKLTI